VTYGCFGKTGSLSFTTGRAERTVPPYLVEVYAGGPAGDASPLTFVVYDGASGLRAVIWGHPEQELLALPVDLCGNQGPSSPAVRARRR
jgi:hypothetical protein